MAFLLIPVLRWLVRNCIASRREQEVCSIGAFCGVVVGLLGALLLPAPVLASHEAFDTYETWSTATVRSDRWRGGEGFGGQEVERVMEVGNLRMRFRREGETSVDMGINFSNNFLSVTNPVSVDQMEAEFQVTSLTVTGCAANPAPSRTRAARLLLGRFNDGTPGGAGDRTGDHFAGINAQRDSNSPDPDGVLRVVGFFARCNDRGCVSVTTVSFVVLPQTVAVGLNFRLRVIWDSPNNQFLFGVDDNPDMPLAYDSSLNVLPARVPFGSVQQGHDTANCTTGPTVTDATTGVFTVKTNLSAIIP